LSAPARALFYLCRTGSSLFEWEYGDDGEGTSDWLHRRFDDPTLPSKKTALGQQGKAAKRGGAGGFAVCEAAFLCCASHSVASNGGPFAERLTRPFLQLAAEKLDALRDACPKPGIVWGNFEGSRDPREPLFILRDLRAAKAINARS